MNSSPTRPPSHRPTPAPPPGPQLVPQRASHPAPNSTPRPHHSPLALWHLLSLDAPTVAALWTIFIARSHHVALPWTAAAAMFAAVWMIYAADRLLDARLLDARLLDSHAAHPLDLEARHRFHHRHRTGFLAALLIAAVALSVLLRSIDARALHLYALLATLLAAWMLLIHIRPIPNGATRRLPKELAVGIFFPAAIFIPTLARTIPTAAALQHLGPLATWLRPNLLPSAALFAAVCTLNCLCLYAWEHPSADQAHWTTRWAIHHLRHLALAIVSISTFVATFSLQRHDPSIALPAAACALSAAALLLLHDLRHRLSSIHLRAAADLVLLTPILLLPFARS